jgi:hypothetical protein
VERQTWAERGTLLSGGFLDIVKRFSPRVEPFAAVRFAVLINGLFLVLCFVGATRQITLAEGMATIIIGALYQAIPMGYLAAMSLMQARRKS